MFLTCFSLLQGLWSQVEMLQLLTERFKEWTHKSGTLQVWHKISEIILQLVTGVVDDHSKLTIC